MKLHQLWAIVLPSIASGSAVKRGLGLALDIDGAGALEARNHRSSSASPVSHWMDTALADAGSPNLAPIGMSVTTWAASQAVTAAWKFIPLSVGATPAIFEASVIAAEGGFISYKYNPRSSRGSSPPGRAVRGYALS